MGVFPKGDGGVNFIGKYDSAFVLDNTGESEKFRFAIDPTQRVVWVTQNKEVSALIKGSPDALQIHLETTPLAFDHRNLDDLSTPQRSQGEKRHIGGGGKNHG